MYRQDRPLQCGIQAVGNIEVAILVLIRTGRVGWEGHGDAFKQRSGI